jgi:hypothetical protein
MPPRTYTFKVELSESDYHALVKAAPKGKAITRRLVDAEEAPNRRGHYLFQGSRPESLLLKALALVYARGALPAIDRALAEAERAEKP